MTDNIIRAMRDEADLSQVALAALVGMEQSKISQLEHGGGNPTLNTILRVAKACAVTVTIDKKGWRVDA